MTAYRNLSNSGLSSGTYAGRVDDTVQAAIGYVLGRLTITSGAGEGNALTATLTDPTGFTALKDGAFGWFKPLAANTSAVTLNIEGIGAVAVRDRSGVALAAGTLAANQRVFVYYDADGGYFCIDSVIGGGVLSTLGIAGIALLTADGTWTAPYNCYVNIYLAGAGGGGARATSGAIQQTTGGTGGEVGIKFALYMEDGEQLDFTAGTGGAANPGSSAETAGNDGSASSVTGPDSFAMTANGGKGGNLGGTGVAGGTGGTGGDIYWPGEASANVTAAFTGGAGTCFGLSESPPTLATVSSVATDPARDALDQINAYCGSFKWIARGGFLSGQGVTTGQGGDGGPGCGGGSGASGGSTVGGGAGGNGFMAVEYSPPVA